MSGLAQGLGDDVVKKRPRHIRGLHTPLHCHRRRRLHGVASHTIRKVQRARLGGPHRMHAAIKALNEQPEQGAIREGGVLQHRILGGLGLE